MTELEKSLYAATKHANAHRIYYVYTQTHTAAGCLFPLTFVSPSKRRTKAYVATQEAQNDALLVYCCSPEQHTSHLVYTSRQETV